MVIVAKWWSMIGGSSGWMMVNWWCNDGELMVNWRLSPAAIITGKNYYSQVTIIDESTIELSACYSFKGSFMINVTRVIQCHYSTFAYVFIVIGQQLSITHQHCDMIISTNGNIARIDHPFAISCCHVIYHWLSICNNTASWWSWTLIIFSQLANDFGKLSVIVLSSISSCGLHSMYD